jgi:catechol 2,3-dioxygenase-like lactoylglutathione lyase family enzyme
MAGGRQHAPGGMCAAMVNRSRSAVITFAYRSWFFQGTRNDYTNAKPFLSTQNLDCKLITKGSPANMSNPNPNHPVVELRVALTTSDYERLVKFYCNGLGIEPAANWNNAQGQATVLNMGKATLEIFDEAQAEAIDQIEVGQRISGQIRFALQVPDLKAAMERLLTHGATLVHPPIQTPWGDYNVRLQDPDGLQITLFQKSGNNDE